MSQQKISQRREWSFLPYRTHKDAATGLVHSLPPVVVEDGIGVIASCGYGGPEHDNELFARLMSAAPNLFLEAFKLVGDIDPESDDRRFDGLRAAMAKATGEQY